MALLKEANQLDGHIQKEGGHAEEASGGGEEGGRKGGKRVARGKWVEGDARESKCV